MKRFDYIKYDDVATERQAAIKLHVENIERMVEKLVVCPSAKKIAMEKLEEFYMWCGKGIRNDQLYRTGKVKLQEERKDT